VKSRSSTRTWSSFKLLQPLGTDPESATIPDEDLQPIALGVAEQEQARSAGCTTIGPGCLRPVNLLGNQGSYRVQVEKCFTPIIDLQVLRCEAVLESVAEGCQIGIRSTVLSTTVDGLRHLNLLRFLHASSLLLLFSLLPTGIGIVFLHVFGMKIGLLAEILLIHHSINADDESHHT
jgi:hypothetical protein